MPETARSHSYALSTVKCVYLHCHPPKKSSLSLQGTKSQKFYYQHKFWFSSTHRAVPCSKGPSCPADPLAVPHIFLADLSTHPHYWQGLGCPQNFEQNTAVACEQKQKHSYRSVQTQPGVPKTQRPESVLENKGLDVPTGP